jgi:hypothetical protein
MVVALFLELPIETTELCDTFDAFVIIVSYMIIMRLDLVSLGDLDDPG